MEEIDLKELFDMFWSRKLLITLIIILFMGIGFIYTKFMLVPDYKSTAKLVLTKNTTNEETISQTEVTLNQKLVATYTELIKSNNILRQVIANLNSDITEEELRNSVTVSLVSNTQLIEISVTNAEPQLARDYTNEITKVFMEKVKEIYKIDNIRLMDEAKVSDKPYNINYTKNILIFAFVGMVLAGGYVMIESMIDTTIKTAEEVEKRLEVNVLASIPKYDYDTKKKGNENGERRTNNK